MTDPQRKYDKGEKRFKHEGRSSQPEIQFSKKNPKVWVGLRPANMDVELREGLLKEAIPAPAGDREIDYPKYLYVVHDGAIYEGRTSDAGVSYHGFPYRGKLSRELLEQLREMARKKQCLKLFEDWVKKHILN
jgi:hypothetical protein